MRTSSVVRARIGSDGDPERTNAIVRVGLPLRQAQFLVTVMLHSGVFVGGQYAAFAGITHGQKVHDLVEKLLVRRFATRIELGSTGRTRIFHVHHKPLYAAIGEPDNGTAGESPLIGQSNERPAHGLRSCASCRPQAASVPEPSQSSVTPSGLRALGSNQQLVFA